MFAQTALVGAAAAAGFDGVYTYDIVVYSGDKFMRLCNAGARDAPALRAVRRAGLRRAARQRRSDASSRAETVRPTTTCGARRSQREPTA